MPSSNEEDSSPSPIRRRRIPRRQPILRSFEDQMDFNEIVEWLENIEFQQVMGRAMEESMIDFDALRRPDPRIIPHIVIGSPREETCSICCYPVDGEVYNIPCRHLFHKACFDEWIGYRRVCPLCLEEIRTITPPP